GGAGSGGGFGSGKGAGSGMGDGKGMGKLFGLIPESMRKRCSKEDRLERLKANGGTPACDEAVSKALRYFKSTQAADGSWGGSTKVAMTGLVLLAYFGHCETPISPEFGESSMKAITFLVDTAMKNNGKLATNFTSKQWPYEHAIATYALGEAATFCQELKINVPSLAEMTGKAGQYVIDNQHESGGWSYSYDLKGGHPDVSVVAWHIQALKACSHTDIKFKGMDQSISKGLDYINNLQDEKTGGIGYDSRGKPVGSAEGYCSLTGAGVLANQMWGKGNRNEVTKGLDYILKETKFEYNTKFADLYGHYYESQAMMQAGGKYWDAYNNLFRDQLLNNQEADGSWKAPGGGQKIRGSEATTGNKVYRTALATLMLEVYYRFLNTDQGIQRKSRKI
ncbi:MAG: terpene cyclase/mutase family protein, partial [Gloeobacteraceae cyanobacterium ES-bin-144]|nr:terpene cyclase/mutase family protein [Verrucomicrobiales bacterium]